MKERFVIYNPVEQTYLFRATPKIASWMSADFVINYPAMFKTHKSAERVLLKGMRWAKKNHPDFHKRHKYSCLEIKKVYIQELPQTDE